MDPKFQSSFIPKGPAAATVGTSSPGSKIKGRSLLSFIALVVFTLSILSALGMFGYKFYLKYRIQTMGADLQTARAALQPETIDELTRLDNRLISTKELISKHYVFTPLFKFLETSTPKTVRFSSLRYSLTEQGLELEMKGEARGYAALAFQADIFSQSDYFKNTIFSDLNLNERGDVKFSLKTVVDPDLLLYRSQPK